MNEFENPSVKIKLLHPNARVPQLQSAGAAAYDVYIPEDAVVSWRQDKIPLGFALEIQPGWCAHLTLRSSLAHFVHIPNSPGIIDSDYRGEVKVVLARVRDFDGAPYLFKAGDRICQLSFHRVYDPVIEVVDELSETTRGTGGFGSTGR